MHPRLFPEIREFILMFGETVMFSVDRINCVSLSCQLCVCLDADNQGKPVTSFKKAKQGVLFNLQFSLPGVVALALAAFLLPCSLAPLLRAVALNLQSLLL